MKRLLPTLLISAALLLGDASCARLGFDVLRADDAGVPVDGRGAADARHEAARDLPRVDADGSGSNADGGIDTTAPDVAASDAPAGPTTVNLAPIALAPPSSTQHDDTLWDLTRCDLTLSYTIDLGGVASAQPDQIQVSVGLRQEGASDFVPLLMGGWMTHIPADYINTDPKAFDLDDKLDLSSSVDDETDYDVDPSGNIVSPFGSYDSKGIWFDRDGASAEGCPGSSVDDYCSGGTYHVVIAYHAVSAQQGTMFATVNGVATGFFINGYHPGGPDITPAGRSFIGDLTRLQAFFGCNAPAATGMVSIDQIQIHGCGG